MRIGVHLGHWEGRPHDVGALGAEAEACGLDSVWVSETWGSDAFTLATWIAARTSSIGVGTAVVQMPGRTPSAAAMAALTLDHLSAGRVRLGLGTSGPAVVEGWHGVAFDRPLLRTREYVEVVRAILAREAPLTHEGDVYPIPLPGGAGRPLKANVVPLRSDVPVYLAAMGPRNVALTAELADGWVPFLYSPDHVEAFAGALDEGFARRGGRPEGFDVAPMVPVALGADLDACRDALRPGIALYVGAYGTRSANFYNDLVSRYGFAQEAAAIQDAALAGRRDDAAAAVTDALVDAVCLVGDPGRVRDRMAAYADAGVTTLLAQTRDPSTIRALAEAAG
jgi:F420-dependent oxidoreductase-like protein